MRDPVPEPIGARWVRARWSGAETPTEQHHERRTIEFAAHCAGRWIRGLAFHVAQASRRFEEVDETVQEIDVVRDVATGIKATVTKQILATWMGCPTPWIPRRDWRAHGERGYPGSPLR